MSLKFSFFLLPFCFYFALGQTHTFEVSGKQFLFDGKSMLIHSGEMHYPRIPHEYWKDRMLKAKAMGLNTICTYIFWNMHEAKPGIWDFTGDLDVAKYIRTAQEVGLHVIIRPGPYVCSEWDFGGLPSWLLKNPGIKLRCMDKVYCAAVEKYMKRLASELKGLQLADGGPIILSQVENEYGSYGNDKQYMKWLEKTMRDAGFTVSFYTADGGADYLLESGALDDALPVVNFGGGPEGEFAALDKFRPGIPKMNGEFWCGWFTHWGDSTWGSSDIAENVKDLKWMLDSSISFNLYMFHGGTNFGWMAGANFSKNYEPDVTSYDYDSPLDETGRPTKKYYAFRDLLLKYEPAGTVYPALPDSPPLVEIPPVTFSDSASLWANLPNSVSIPQPVPMEDLDQSYGYIFYRTTLVGPMSGMLNITELHDYAQVYLGGAYVGAIDRTKGETTLKVPKAPSDHPQLDILVEGMGRINFGQRLIDRKGITERVTLGGVTLMDWQAYRLPMDDGSLSRLKYRHGFTIQGPKYYEGKFSLNETGDTYLDMTGWKKGVVWVNGRNLGRFWDAGPQQRLFLPAPWLKKGENTIVVFDIGATHPQSISSKASMR